MNSVLEVARTLVACGLSVLPIKPDGSKAPPLRTWKPYQSKIASVEELQSWFSEPWNGLALVCGSVSQNLECLDIDDIATAVSFPNELAYHHPDLYAKVVQVETPRGGLHLWYRCVEPVGGSKKLALVEVDGRPKTLIETRGEGAYALIPPSPPECHELKRAYRLIRGSLDRLSILSGEDVQALYQLAKSYDQTPAKPEPTPERRVIEKWVGQPHGDGQSPADDFDIRGSWEDLLKPFGWSLASGSWESGRLIRPGKGKGVSATVGHCKGNHGEPLLHVFSSNAAPLEDGKTYGKYQALRVLKFAGDGAETMRHLRKEGYGGGGAGGVIISPLKSSGKATGSLHEIVQAEVVPKPTEVKKNGGNRPIIKTLSALLDEELPEPRWAVPGLLAEGLTILAGKPKLGKSWLALNLAITIAAGGMALQSIRVQPGKVLYLALEDRWRRIQDRARKVLKGCGIAKNNNLHFATAWPSQDRGGCDELSVWVHEASREGVPPTLLVIDVWQKFRSPTDNASKRGAYEADYQQVSEVKSLADHYGISVLVIHHTRKGAAEDVFDEISGTQGIAGAADGSIVLVRSRNENSGTLAITGRDIEESTKSVSFDPETFVWSLQGNAEDVVSGETQKAILNYLRAVGKSGAFCTDIASSVGKSVDSVRKILNRLLTDRIVKKKGNAWVYPMEDE